MPEYVSETHLPWIDAPSRLWSRRDVRLLTHGRSSPAEARCTSFAHASCMSVYALVVDSAPGVYITLKNGHKMNVAGFPTGHQTLMFWNRMYLKGDEQAGRENMTPNERAE